MGNVGKSELTPEVKALINCAVFKKRFSKSSHAPKDLPINCRQWISPKDGMRDHLKLAPNRFHQSQRAKIFHHKLRGSQSLITKYLAPILDARPVMHSSFQNLEIFLRFFGDIFLYLRNISKSKNKQSLIRNYLAPVGSSWPQGPRCKTPAALFLSKSTPATAYLN